MRKDYSWKSVKRLTNVWEGQSKGAILETALNPYIRLVHRLERIPFLIRLHILVTGTLPDEF